VLRISPRRLSREYRLLVMNAATRRSSETVHCVSLVRSVKLLPSQNVDYKPPVSEISPYNNSNFTRVPRNSAYFYELTITFCRRNKTYRKCASIKTVFNREEKYLWVSCFTSLCRLFIYATYVRPLAIPVAARSKAQLCGRAHAGIVISNPTGGHERLSLVQCLCCQVEVSATGRSLVQRSSTECGVCLSVIK
jgi:hypothetical protein